MPASDDIFSGICGDDVKENLANLIDEHGLAAVLRGMAEICKDNAEEIDIDELEKQFDWLKAAKTLLKTAIDVEP